MTLSEQDIQMAGGVGVFNSVLVQLLKKLLPRWVTKETAPYVTVLLNVVVFGSVLVMARGRSWTEALVMVLLALGAGHLSYKSLLQPLMEMKPGVETKEVPRE